MRPVDQACARPRWPDRFRLSGTGRCPPVKPGATADSVRMRTTSATIGDRLRRGAPVGRRCPTRPGEASPRPASRTSEACAPGRPCVLRSCSHAERLPPERDPAKRSKTNGSIASDLRDHVHRSFPEVRSGFQPLQTFHSSQSFRASQKSGGRTAGRQQWGSLVGVIRLLAFLILAGSGLRSPFLDLLCGCRVQLTPQAGPMEIRHPDSGQR